MVDQPTKFIGRLEPKQSKRVEAVIAKITSNQLARLDIKPLKGRRHWYRCRVGQVRIIFIKTSSGRHIIHTIDFRGGVYR